ncbi:hypothetical protein SALWKB12_0097 [Snodgrassella communis]|nr:hypothetical protein SALWKB12_0097 [Snodgrassella communis]
MAENRAVIIDDYAVETVSRRVGLQLAARGVNSGFAINT